VLSFTQDVPERQAFPLGIYLVPYARKVDKHSSASNKGKGVEEADIHTDPESDVEALLVARRPVKKAKTKQDAAAAADKAAGGAGGVAAGAEPKPQDPVAAGKKEKKLEFVSPSGWDELSAADVASLEAPPQINLIFDSVHGYNGKKCSGNIGVLKGGEVVYPVGSTVLVLDRILNKYKVFSGHDDMVTCLTVGPDKETIATATVAAEIWDAEREKWRCEPELCIWNGSSLSLKHRFRKDFESCIVALSFAKKEPWIVVVGGDDSKEMAIVVYDYEKGSTVVKEDRAGKNRIISLAVNPIAKPAELSFVTVGVRHVSFWSFERGRLVVRKAVYDCGRGSETMVSVAFTDPDHVSADRDVTFTGSKDGRVFIWKGIKAVWNVQCCTGAPNPKYGGFTSTKVQTLTHLLVQKYK
jgi:hypothetical protein